MSPIASFFGAIAGRGSEEPHPEDINRPDDLGDDMKKELAEKTQELSSLKDTMAIKDKEQQTLQAKCGHTLWMWAVLIGVFQIQRDCC
jgi:hypothetical protein